MELSSTLAAAPAPRWIAALRGWLRAAAAALREADARRQQRRFERDVLRSLGALDERTLKDIGLYRSEPWSAALLDDPGRICALRPRSAASGRRRA